MVFTFGSNCSGVHGAGAARTAHREYGALWGKGEGLAGNSYALPTVGEGISTMPFAEAKKHVAVFLAFAQAHSALEFQVTRVGCGLAGFRDAQIAPLFAQASTNCLFDTAWTPWLPKTARYWGTF